MRISQSQSPFTRFYSLCRHLLAEVESAKYLGIIITNELKWSDQLTAVANRGSSTLGFIKRNLKGCPFRLKEIAYITLVRSVLEYSAPIWDPHLAKDIQALERIQRRAARFVKSDYAHTSSVTSMLEELGWKNLAHRRRDLRLALLFKVVNDQIAVPVDSINLEHTDSRTRSSHGYTFRVQRAQTDELKFSFAPRTIIEWNSLPASVVDADSVETFRSRLAKVAWD